MLRYKILPFIDPNLIFVNVANSFGSIFLDSSQVHPHYANYSFIVLNPIQYYSSNDSLCNELSEFNKLIKENKSIYNPYLPPFTGGLVGYLSYDLARQLEVISTTNYKNNMKDYYLGLYNQVIAFDYIKNLCYLMVTEIKGFDLNYEEQFDKLIDLYNSACTNIKITDLPKINLSSNFSKDEYISKVEQAKQHILAGDIFEINLSQRFSGEIDSSYDAYQLYNKLRKINQAPFGSYLNLGDFKILSSSPERFLSIKNRHIEVRPIKGTKQRSDDPKHDQRLAEELKTSTKDRAENIMIVDLMRNDLAKICILESIKVSQLCDVESFTNVHHLVSVIEGELKNKYSIFDIIPACFPGGSITGAPKIRAMQIIDKLEQCNRGVYCGNIGYFGFNETVDLSIAIRTIVIDKNKLSFNVGGAITYDSNPEDEYNETLVKGQKLMEAICV